MLNGLNAEQLDAVTTDKNTLIIACPGSGKTRVLTRKIAYEIERMASKKKFIIALTYTNRAAEEIQRRLDAIGVPQDQLWAGTIHSFCYQWIIKPYSGYEPSLVNGFSIIDEYKKQQIINQLKKKYSIPIYTDINTAINRNGNYSNRKPSYNRLAEEFHKNIQDNKEIDFDLLLYYSYNLLIKHEKIRKHLANLISYIFVDEYQDTQDLQYAIIGQIIIQSNSLCKLFLVGDPDQAIYKSLGGISKNLFEIQEEIGQQEIILKELSGNYRSTKRVVDFFNNFQSTDIKIQALGKIADDKGIITFDSTTSKDGLYKVFAKIIRDNIKNGVKPSEICVIAPRWFQLTSLARKLKAVLPEIPFDAPGATPLPRNRENFWWRLSRLFLSEITPETSLNRIRWVKEIIGELNKYSNLHLGVEYNDCRRYLKLINSIQTTETDGIKYLEEVFSSFFTELDIDLENNFVLKDHWDTFFTSIRAKYSLPEFEGVSTNIDYFKSVFKPSSGVVVNTCFGVKGEEFETVIAFGLLWGYLPHWDTIINESSIEVESESKKMLYVIGSRAKKNLHLFAETGWKTIKGNPYETNYDLEGITFDYDDVNSIY